MGKRKVCMVETGHEEGYEILHLLLRYLQRIKKGVNNACNVNEYAINDNLFKFMTKICTLLSSNWKWKS